MSVSSSRKPNWSRCTRDPSGGEAAGNNVWILPEEPRKEREKSRIGWARREVSSCREPNSGVHAATAGWESPPRFWLVHMGIRGLFPVGDGEAAPWGLH